MPFPLVPQVRTRVRAAEITKPEASPAFVDLAVMGLDVRLVVRTKLRVPEVSLGPREAQNRVVDRTEVLGIRVSCRALPDDLGTEIFRAEDLVEQNPGEVADVRREVEKQ